MIGVRGPSAAHMVGSMTYELWNTRTRNAIGDFGSQTEALAVVRDVIARHGRDYANMLFLGCEDASGHSRPIAQGQALVAMALRSDSRQAVPG